MKLPAAWKPDEWVCHHSGNRGSTRMSDYYHHQSNGKSVTTSRNLDSPTSSKRISTAKLRRGKCFCRNIHSKYSSFFALFFFP